MKPRFFNKDNQSKIKWSVDDFSEEFREYLSRILISGTPATNKHDHSSTIQFRVRPDQIQLVNKIVEKIPGWLPDTSRNKGSSHFHRSLHAIGCAVVLQELENQGVIVKRLQNNLYKLARISSGILQDELDQDYLKMDERIHKTRYKNKKEISNAAEKIYLDIDALLDFSNIEVKE